MKKRKQRITVPDLDDIYRIRVAELLKAAQRLEREHGPDAVVVFDAGFNNIIVTLEEAAP